MYSDEHPALPLEELAEPTATGRSADAWSKPALWALTFAGVLLPLICFAFSFPMEPEWQSGSTEAYAQLLLSHKCSAPLYPFLLYCMTSLILVVWRPQQFAGRLVARWGVYFGVLVAAEYWIVFQSALPGDNPEYIWRLGFSLLVVLVTWGAWRVVNFLRRRGLLAIVWGLGILSCAGALLVFGLDAIPSAILIVLWCSTPWALAAYAAVTIDLVRSRPVGPLRFSLAQLFGVIAVLAAHLAAWRLSFAWMLKDYAKLPTDPRCFVCRAAAGGHQCIVHSATFATTGHVACRVNDQLRTLKAFELLLASLSPKSHRCCRWIYDRVGPPAAALLCHPLLADAAYLLLKPAEWFARVCLLVAIPGQMKLVRGLYRASSP